VIRVACALQLVALGILMVFLVDPTGPAATAFSFLGMPLIAISIVTYALTLLRRRTQRAAAPGEGRTE
jgi:hypothetical protein